MMKKLLLTMGFIALPSMAFAQSVCEGNAAAQTSLQPQYESMLCAYGTAPVDEAQARIDAVSAELAANEETRLTTREQLNDAADRTIKTDAKISSLIEESNVSTDNSILILGVTTYESIKDLQVEREDLVGETLTLQGQLDELDATRDDLHAQLVMAQADLAAAAAVEAVRGETLTSLRDSLTRANDLATSICGMEAVEVAETCPEPSSEEAEETEEAA